MKTASGTQLSVVDDVGLSRLPETERALLQDMREGYQNHRLSRREAASTITEGDRTLLDFFRFAAGIPGQVTPEDFERWAAHLYLDRGVAASTQRKYQTTVRVFFDYLLRTPRYRTLVRTQLGVDIVQVATIENCIIHQLQDERSKKHGRRNFSPKEVEDFFTTIEREISYAFASNMKKTLYPLQRNKVLFGLAYHLGLRAEEVLGLNLSSFEPNPRAPEFGRFGIVHVLGKGSKWRAVVVMHPDVPALLEWYIATVRPQFVTKAAPDENALFLSERGGRLSYSMLNSAFRHIIDLAGLPRELVPHCLRHTSVSDKAMAGLSLEANRLNHGHTYGATTQTYLHVPDEFVQREFRNIIDHNIQEKMISDRK